MIPKIIVQQQASTFSNMEIMKYDMDVGFHFQWPYVDFVKTTGPQLHFYRNAW